MLRRISHRAVPFRSYATRLRRRAPTPVVDIESQVSEFPEEQRKQILGHVHGELPLMDQKEVAGNDFTANLILGFLETAESPADLDAGFWKTVRRLARSATHQRNPEYLDIFAALFDSAKSIVDEELRQEMLFLIGRYIYRQKQVRMDPINEVEFLDTLVLKGRVFNALSFWRTRQAKPDVAGSIYWSEVGALYYIEAGLLRSADALAVKMTEEFDGYTPPRVVMALIDGYARLIRRGRDVQFAKQRLEAWSKKLLSASVIYKNVVAAGDEHISLEDKLQERKEVTSSDLSRSLTAIIAARQWDLAAQLASSFDTMDNEDLMKALETANTSGYRSEESVMPFLDAILTQDPERVRDGRLAATIVLSFARTGDLEDMVEILRDMHVRKFDLPDASQKYIARAILSQRSISLEERVSTINKCLGGPNAAREVVRTLRKEKVGLVPQYWAHYDGEVTSDLALNILRSRVIKDEADVLRLGVSPETWKYIWYLIASRKVFVSPQNAFKTMMRQANSAAVLSDSVMSLVTPAMIVTNASVVDGAAAALAAVRLVSEKLDAPISRLSGTVLLETLKKVSRGRSALFTPPAAKDPSAALMQHASTTQTVSLEHLVKHAATILQTQDLDLLVHQAMQELLS